MSEIDQEAVANSRIRYDQQVGRKGRVFVVLAGVELLPEGDLVWQELASEDDLGAATVELERVIIQRVGETPMTPGEKRAALAKYDGAPLIILERTEVLRYATGYTTPH